LKPNALGHDFTEWHPNTLNLKKIATNKKLAVKLYLKNESSEIV